MGRFLFVVPPLHGHTNPTISVGRALRDRGHAVAWAGYNHPSQSLLPDDAEVLPVFQELPEDIVESVQTKSRGLRGAASLNFLFEDFMLPMARAMAEGVDRAIDLFQPDVVISDQQTLAGAIVAERRGLPWATSATTSGEFMYPFARMPKLEAWINEKLHQLQRDLGLPEDRVEKCNPRFSEHLIIVFSVPELVGITDFPPKLAFVGASVHARPEVADFPWEWLDESRPRLLISLGTLNAEAGSRFFRAVLEAFAEPDRQVILVAPPDAVGPVPDHFLVRDLVPQLSLLKRVSGVVCHGGHNTVCESLAEGLPLVVCPIRDDQPLIAQQVANTKTNIQMRFGRVRAEALRSAVDQILTEPSFRRAARSIGDSLRRAGGAAYAAERLEALL